MASRIKLIAIRSLLGSVVFCLTLAGVLGGWGYVQANRDQTLLRDFAKAHELNLNLDKGEKVMAVCEVKSSVGKCSALRFKVKKSTCVRVVSKLRGLSVGCSRAFIEFKNKTIQVTSTGFSEKPGLYLDIVVMKQHALLNII